MSIGTSASAGARALGSPGPSSFANRDDSFIALLPARGDSEEGLVITILHEYSLRPVSR